MPLFRPLKANPRIGTPTPPGQDALSGNFFKKSFPKITPPDGTQGKKFQTDLSGGNPEEQARRIPLKKRLHASVECSGFDQGVSSRLGALPLEVLSAGKVVQGMGDDTPGRCLNACYFRSKHHPVSRT